jgi:hypothetical protein
MKLFIFRNILKYEFYLTLEYLSVFEAKLKKFFMVNQESGQFFWPNQLKPKNLIDVPLRGRIEMLEEIGDAINCTEHLLIFLNVSNFSV